MPDIEPSCEGVDIGVLVTVALPLALAVLLFVFVSVLVLHAAPERAMSVNATNDVAMTE